MAQAMRSQYDEALEVALKLKRGDQVRLVQRIVAELGEVSHSEATAIGNLQQDEAEVPYTEEEIAEMLRPKPKTGAEIVASDVVGAWADIGITDSEEWLNEQKRKRREAKWRRD